MDTEAMAHIREGMRVVDANGDEIGTVEVLKMGDPEAATAQGQTTGEDGGLVGDLARGLGGDGPEVPDDQRERLLRLGYIKVDRKGLFSGDLYVTSDDIERVDGDSVRLTITPE